MLNKLGAFIVKNRWWVIATWVVLAITITSFAPKLSDVTSTDQTSFLPSKYESVQAQKIADKAFPQTKDDTEILLVKHAGGGKLTASDQQAIQTLASQLKAAKLDRVEDVRTSASSQNVSKDGKAQMVQITVKGQATGDTKDVNFVKTLRDKIHQLVSGTGLTTGLTGNIANNADSNSQFSNTTKIVTMATFALIIILPGIIFRSPVAAFAPAIAVGIVFALAQSIIALLAKIFSYKIDNSAGPPRVARGILASF